MIQLHTSEGREIYLSPSAIVEIREAGTSSQWHGTRSFLKMSDGRTIEVGNTASEVARLVREDVQKAHLLAQLEGRERAPVDVDAYGAPALRED